MADDLREGDTIEVDLGAEMVKGQFRDFEKRNGKYFLTVTRGKRIEAVLTKQIVDIRVIKR